MFSSRRIIRYPETASSMQPKCTLHDRESRHETRESADAALASGSPVEHLTEENKGLSDAGPFHIR
ncbi:hypothetical protein J21TS7_45200 [Paenibacillus cineris]|uniref:Uncharacterized protein n=1 Tax=Paenibacillus cineris TaxID=237530 RepID=A0ABQ4LI70_9BACL|nr:hypothetical protein J21TS7_45200 [Paenibacillus cineris]